VTAVAMPGVAVALVLALSEVSFSGLRSQPRLLAAMPGSLVEAALTRDVPEVTLRLTLGESPRRRARVRLRTGAVVEMDALDAAVLSGRSDMVRVMLTQGPAIDPDTIHHLRCLAQGADVTYRDGQVRGYLEKADTSTASCDGFLNPLDGS
jgi:hypothetical protein